MKKILTLIIVAGMTTFFACGPSAKEKAEKAKQDSLGFTKDTAITILYKYCNKNFNNKPDKPGQAVFGIGQSLNNGAVGYCFNYNELETCEQDLSITSFIKENTAEVEFIIRDYHAKSNQKTLIKQKINFSFDGGKWKIIEDDNSKKFLLIFLGYKHMV